MLAESATVALTVNVGSILVANAYLGASIAVMHGLVGAQMRAVASAIFFLILNIIGLGLGPFTVGLCSDFLSSEFGKESLRYAMVTIIPVVGVWSAAHFFLAAKTLREDLAAAPA